MAGDRVAAARAAVETAGEGRVAGLAEADPEADLAVEEAAGLAEVGVVSSGEATRATGITSPLEST
jgi:hypothetical protein